MKETQCNSKLCISDAVTYHKIERNSHSEYTHNEGRKDIIEDCENILLKRGLYYSYIVSNVNCYLFMYSGNLRC